MVKKFKKIKTSKNAELKFNITNYNKKDYYLFNVTRYDNIIHGITDINTIKPNNIEINTIKNEIEKIVDDQNINLDKKVIQILPNYYEIFVKLEKTDLSKSIYAKNIESIFNNLKNHNKIVTLKKISEDYEKKFNKKISLTTVSRILKNHLNIKYLKTCIKNPKLAENNYKLMSFIFIRGIIRALELKLNFIFVDETGFLIQNNNFNTWRRQREEILGGPKNKVKERINLILAISQQKVVHKTFINYSVDSDVFIKFLKEMISNYSAEEKENLIIIMDNATFHLTKDVINFFRINKIKGLTICPYKSNFNMIELVFRFIKNITYKKVYNNIYELKKDVIKILEGKKLKTTLPNLFKETLEQYIVFVQNNYNINLKN